MADAGPPPEEHMFNLKAAFPEAAMERDNFMTGEEAKTFGLIDEVVEKRPVDEDENGETTDA